ncbi:MAG: N-acetylneuraminate synthase family protein [Elusimicrobia bacterium]|nr:N-acetylneuraminate synthase family protein [Elusimicrobiota bacterium]
MTRAPGRKPFVIAEAGNNHNGDLKTALGLVDLAKRADADSVKFQIINPEGLYLPAFYEGGGYRANPVIEARRRTALCDDDYGRIAEHCKARGMDWSASVFDEESLALLLRLRPSYVKIASCDLNNIMFLKKAAQRAGAEGVRMVLSTGMSTLGEIERSVAALAKEGFSDLVLLHCVSVYPAPLVRMNLGFIDVLKKTFALPVGLSDHTQDSLASVMALAKGAEYFEKHVTLSRDQEGFDHAHSLEEPAFARYVKDLRESFEAVSGGGEKLSEEELAVRRRARRSLYAARRLERGEAVREEDVLVVRPEAAMRADEAGSVVGKRCKDAIMQYQPFTPDLLE